MGPKKKMMPLELKREIIEKHEQGVRVTDLARMYGRSTSMICTMLKKKDLIKGITPAKGVTIISKLRTSLHEKMENQLIVWMAERQLQGEILTQSIICEQARGIYRDLLKEIPQASEDSFKASRGWFDNFRKRAGIHTIVRHVEERSSDVNVFMKTFSDVVEAEGYIPPQVFNFAETGLFWKRMPNRTYITAEEKTLPGFQPMKDRLSIVLCANASGDCKIKPLLVYHTEVSRTFKSQKFSKEKLQVMWRTNPKACVTRTFLVEWMNQVFGPTVKKYLQENDLPMQALVVVDSTHTTNLEDDLLEEFKFIKILYLPPNTTTILQPMDQQVISNFKMLYTKHMFRRCSEVMENTNLTLLEFWKDHFNIVTCLKIIEEAWMDVTMRTLTSAWKNLWPEAEMAFEELEPEMSVVDEIVTLGKSIGLLVDAGDVIELIEEHSREPTAEELVVQPKISIDEEPKKVASIKDIKEMLGMWEKVVDFLDKHHPEKVATRLTSQLFDQTCLTHFRNMLKGRKKQTDGLKRSSGESKETVTKKAKTGDKK